MFGLSRNEAVHGLESGQRASIKADPIAVFCLATFSFSPGVDRRLGEFLVVMMLLPTIPRNVYSLLEAQQTPCIGWAKRRKLRNSAG